MQPGESEGVSSALAVPADRHIVARIPKMAVVIACAAFFVCIAFCIVWVPWFALLVSTACLGSVGTGKPTADARGWMEPEYGLVNLPV